MMSYSFILKDRVTPYLKEPISNDFLFSIYDKYESDIIYKLSNKLTISSMKFYGQYFDAVNDFIRMTLYIYAYIYKIIPRGSLLFSKKATRL